MLLLQVFLCMGVERPQPQPQHRNSRCLPQPYSRVTATPLSACALQTQLLVTVIIGATFMNNAGIKAFVQSR